GRVKMDRAIEGVRPLNHRRVKMRMRDADRLEAAEGLDRRDRRSIQERDAVPQDVAVRRAHQDRALAKGEGRLRADADDARLVFAHAVHVAACEFLKRRPALPAWRDILPLSGYCVPQAVQMKRGMGDLGVSLLWRVLNGIV